jgi:hypothetical protein
VIDIGHAADARPAADAAAPALIQIVGCASRTSG